MAHKASRKRTSHRPGKTKQKVMEGVCVAIVKAPGGVAIGFSGPSESSDASS